MSQNQPGSDDLVASALHQVLSDYGRRVTENPQRLRAMLNDALGASAADHRAAVDALVIAAEEGVPSALREQSADEAGLVGSLTQWGLDGSIAQWAVAAWAGAMTGVVSIPPTALPPTAVPPTTVPPTALPPTELPQRPPGQGAAVVGGTAQPPITSDAEPEGAAAASAGVAGGVAALAGMSAAGPGSNGDDGASDGKRTRRGLVAAAVALVVLAGGGTAFALSNRGGDVVADPTASNRVSSPGPSSPSSGTSAPGTLPTGPSPSVTPSLTPTMKATAAKPSAGATHTKVVVVTHTAAPRTTSAKAKPAAPKAANMSYDYIAEWSTSAKAFFTAHPPNGLSATGTWNAVVIDSFTSGYPGGLKAWVSGKNIYWQPTYNGVYTATITWHVVNTTYALSSNHATISIRFECNTLYKCN